MNRFRLLRPRLLGVYVVMFAIGADTASSQVAPAGAVIAINGGVIGQGGLYRLVRWTAGRTPSRMPRGEDMSRRLLADRDDGPARALASEGLPPNGSEFRGKLR